MPSIFFTINNEEWVSKMSTFFENSVKNKKKTYFKNIASISCRECQALLADVRIIILLSITKEE